MDPQVLSQSFVYETIKIGGTNPECDVIRESGRHTGKTNADTHSFKGSQLCSQLPDPSKLHVPYLENQTERGFV